MHEAAIAQNLFEATKAEAQKQNAKPISVKISCGVFSAVNDELLNFAFEALTKDTVCQGASLVIEHKPIVGICRNCKGRFDFDIYNPHCPSCNGEEFDLSSDPPLLLESIEFDTE